MNAGRTQIKICGLTGAAQARECERLGADAIGMVFFPKSPRNVTPEQACRIRAALTGTAKLVGVFVNMPPAEMIQVSLGCGLDAVQLHGSESPEDVRRLRGEGMFVLKALKGEDFAAAAGGFAAAGVNAFLLELGKGPLPGGNGQGWDWAKAAGFPHPYLLAGGLRPENVAQAIAAAQPDGVDASSSLEATPGVKDMSRVEQFINAVRELTPARQLQRIF